jgi:AraC family transcriptional regulator
MPTYISLYEGLHMEKPELLQLDPIKAAYVYSLSANPEEDALNKVAAYAQPAGLTKGSSRLFGRNIYPTDKPEPHGYEYYLTTEAPIDATREVVVATVPGGLYAVSEIKDLQNLVEGWQKLFSWVETSGHKPAGVVRGAHGWVNSAFEELLDWQQQKPPSEWVFRLMIQLKE